MNTDMTSAKKIAYYYYSPRGFANERCILKVDLNNQEHVQELENIKHASEEDSNTIFYEMKKEELTSHDRDLIVSIDDIQYL